MDRVLLLTHRLPDGDAIGSIYALYLTLKAMAASEDTIVAELA